MTSRRKGQDVFVEDFALECGQVLRSTRTRYLSWGQLNDQRNNVLVLFHAMNCSQNVEEWWGPLLGPGRALDTDKYFVFCANALGGCYGSTGPDDVDEQSGRRYGGSFPSVTIRDMVRLQAAVLRKLGVTSVACAMGGGLGGMLALEWAVEVCEPSARSVISLCSSGRHQPWQIGWGECQRHAIMADPRWQGGDYDPAAPPSSGLAVARMMAMVSYRTHPAYWSKFGRSVSQEQEVFDVEAYLQHQGDKFINRGFSPRSYITLTRAMDSHDVSRGRGTYADVLGSISLPVLLASISSDVLYPVNEQVELAEHLPNAQHHLIESPEGHDGFLIEHNKVSTLVHGFILDLETAEARAAPSSKL